MINKESLRILRQYISALDESYIKLEKAYLENDFNNFSKIKSFIKEIQARIAMLVKQ